MGSGKGGERDRRGVKGARQGGAGKRRERKRMGYEPWEEKQWKNLTLGKIDRGDARPR